MFACRCLISSPCVCFFAQCQFAQWWWWWWWRGSSLSEHRLWLPHPPHPPHVPQLALYLCCCYPRMYCSAFFLSETLSGNNRPSLRGTEQLLLCEFKADTFFFFPWLWFFRVGVESLWGGGGQQWSDAHFPGLDPPLWRNMPQHVWVDTHSAVLHVGIMSEALCTSAV